MFLVFMLCKFADDAIEDFACTRFAFILYTLFGIIHFLGVFCFCMITLLGKLDRPEYA